MNTSTFCGRLTTAASVFAGVLLTGIITSPLAYADDAELYQTSNYELGPAYYANVLFIIDTSGSMATDVDGRSRLQVVKDVVQNFVNTLQYVNIGLMRFDSGYSVGGVFSEANFREGGGMVLQAIEDVNVARGDFLAEMNALTASGTTQLSETMFEAASYFLGFPVYFGLETYAGPFSSDALPENYRPSDPASRNNSDTYVSPAGECQQNHIVYLTDGQPQFDSEITDVVPTWPNFEGVCSDNPDWNWSAFSVDGDGDCLDDIAAYLHENDLYGTEEDGIQNVITHTIGFFQDLPLLEETAQRGGGKYYLANDADSLLSVLESIFVDVNETGTSFTSPGVSVNAFDRTTHLDQLFYSVFQATGRTRWEGNIKRYRLGANLDGNLVVLDADGGEAVDQNSGFFREDSRSFWSEAPDGFAVSAGGAAAELNQLRNTYTELGGQLVPLNAGSLAELESTLMSKLDVQRMGRRLAQARDEDPATYDNRESEVLSAALQWLSGTDVLDVDGDGITNEARQRLGDPMHSKPVVVTYAGSAEMEEPTAVVFVGTNDGFLHAIDGTTGYEVSAFMPYDMIPNIDDWFYNMETNERTYGVDGPITAWVKDGGDGNVDPGDSVMLYFGLRRGGNFLYAMDYTNPAAPQPVWSIDPWTPGFSRLGQTWSPITRTRVKTGTFGAEQEVEVLVFGGGYDTRQDDYSNYAPDNMGNAIYMVNAATGELVWSGSSANVADTTREAWFPEMQSAITGAIRVVDIDGDGFMDLMYAADLGGRVWRLDVHNPREEGDAFHVTGGVMASLGAPDSGVNRRFYYAPDVALGEAAGRTFFNVTVASGYRAHPKDASITDKFYVLRDYFPFTELGLSEDPAAEYVEKYGYVEDDLLSIGALESQPEGLPAGYSMPLVTANGEKVLSETRIFQNKATFTSYIPANEQTQGCFPALGSGQLYQVDLGGGGITVEVLDKPGIPPEVVYIFTDDDSVGYEPPRCYGDDCIDPGDGGGGEGEEGADDDDDDGTPGARDIGCVIGPESCDAAGAEVPIKTYWREENTDVNNR